MSTRLLTPIRWRPSRHPVGEEAEAEAEVLDLEIGQIRTPQDTVCTTGPTGMIQQIAETMHNVPSRNPLEIDMICPRRTGPRPGTTTDMGVRRPLLVKGMYPHSEGSMIQRGPGKGVGTEEIGKLEMKPLSTRWVPYLEACMLAVKHETPKGITLGRLNTPL